MNKKILSTYLIRMSSSAKYMKQNPLLFLILLLLIKSGKNVQYDPNPPFNMDLISLAIC